MLVPVLMLSLVGQFVSATDKIQVTAVVPQIPPPFAPSITSPTNGSKVTDSPLSIKGSCPLATPAVIIAIYEGTNVIGSANCDNNTGSYSIPVSLDYGTHTIYAQVVTFTSQFGKRSDDVTFTRIFTVASQPPSVRNQPTTLPLLNTLTILNAQPLINFGPTTEAIWRGTVTGGTPPYKVHIAWGDGTSNDYVVIDQAEQTFKHHYPGFINEQTMDNGDITSPGKSKNSADTIKTSSVYNLIITITDADGKVTILHITAASAPPLIAPLIQDLVHQRTWYESLMQSDVTKIYAGLFTIIVASWVIRRIHDRNIRHQGHHKPLRHAHT